MAAEVYYGSMTFTGAVQAGSLAVLATATFGLAPVLPEGALGPPGTAGRVQLDPTGVLNWDDGTRWNPVPTGGSSFATLAKLGAAGR